MPLKSDISLQLTQYRFFQYRWIPFLAKKWLTLFMSIVISGCISPETQFQFQQTAPQSASSIRAPSLLAEVLMHLQLDYSKPEMLEPEKLLVGALIELERWIPEFRFKISKINQNNPAKLKINFAEKSSNFDISQLYGLYDLNHLLNNILLFLSDETLLIETANQWSELRLEEVMAHGILSTLDPYSVLLPDEIYREFRINIGGQFAGIGLVVGTQNGQLTVVSPMDGSPAALAGIRPMDRIIGVDGEETEHMTLEEILYRLRGKTDSSVMLEVMRKGEASPLKFDLIRKKIQVESVVSQDLKMEAQKVRYLRIKTFQTGTSKEIKNKLNALTNIEGIILDLRNNPGGLLDEAIRVSDIFLKRKQKIVSTRGPMVSSVHFSKKLYAPEKWQNIPMIVLINKGSASASEIVAAALKQNKRALIIGEQSYGKGSIQTMWNLKDGTGLKLTIGEYLTPNGRSIQSIGVLPDLMLLPISIPTVSKKTNSTVDNLSSSKKYLRFHLLPDLLLNKSNDNQTYEMIRYLKVEKTEKNDLDEFLSQPKQQDLQADIYINIAQQIFAEKTINHNLASHTLVLKKVKQAQQSKIISALKIHQIDWSNNAGNEEVDAEKIKIISTFEKIGDQRVRLHLNIQNKSKQTLHRLIVISSSGSSILDGLEFPVGKIEPFQTINRELDIKYSPGLLQSTEPLGLVLYNQQMKYIKKISTKLSFPESRAASLQFKIKIHDNGKFGSIGNGDGEIQIGETIALGIEVKNTNEETVPELLLRLRRVTGAFGKITDLKINRGKIQIHKLEANKFQHDYLLFHILNDSKKLGKLKLEIEDVESGLPAMELMLDLSKKITDEPIFTPYFSNLLLQDQLGKEIEGESFSPNLVLKGSLKRTANVRDLIIHVNNKKIYYSTEISQFQIPIQLQTGKNRIVLIVRNKQGVSSKRKIRVLMQPK